MYGLLLQAALEFIVTKFSQDMAREILEASESPEGSQSHEGSSDVTGGSNTAVRSVRAGFAVHQLYSDKMLSKLAAATSRLTGMTLDSVMEQLGQFFVRFTRQSGYDSLLRLVGRNLREFIMGLDNLHEYFRGTYPKIKAPSFIVLQEDADGMLICYRSPRGGLHGYVVGQMKEVARIYFNIQMSITTLSMTEDTRGRWSANMKLEFDNSSQFLMETHDKLCIDDISGRLLKAEAIMDSIPFYVAFNKDLEIASIGRGLKVALPTIVGDDFNETFEIIRPTIISNWDSIMDYRNNVFEIQSLKAVERREQKMGTLQAKDDDDRLIPIRMRGQMIYFKEWDCLIFMAMPVIESMKELIQLGLKVHELSMADSSRDLLTLKHHKEIGKDPLLVQEAKIGAKLDFLTKEATGFKTKRATLLEEAVPKFLLQHVSSMGKTQSAERVAVLSCEFHQIDELVASSVTPKDVVSMLNGICSKFDAVVAKYNFMRVFTISDEYIVAFGIPLLSQLPANFAVLVAVELFEAVDAANKETAKSKSSIKPDVRIGIDMGPVVAAVVGITMPRYIVFGRTVTVATRLSLLAPPKEITVTGRVVDALESNEFKDSYLTVYQKEIGFPDAPHLGVVSIYRIDILDRKKLTKTERKVKMATSANRGLLEALEGSSRATTPMTAMSGHVREESTEAGSGRSSSAHTNTNRASSAASVAVSHRTALSDTNHVTGGGVAFATGADDGSDDEDEDSDEEDGEQSDEENRQKCLAKACKVS